MKQTSLKSSSTGCICADAETFIECLSEIPQSRDSVLCLTTNTADENKIDRTFSTFLKLPTADGCTSVNEE